jgi:ribosome-interacting GTPase 1
MSIRSRRGGSGVEQGGDACVALVGIPELSSPAMMILSLSRITSANSEKDMAGDYYFPGLTTLWACSSISSKEDGKYGYHTKEGEQEQHRYRN